MSMARLFLILIGALALAAKTVGGHCCPNHDIYQVPNVVGLPIPRLCLQCCSSEMEPYSALSNGVTCFNRSNAHLKATR